MTEKIIEEKKMFKDDDKHETCYCENCLELQQNHPQR